MSRNGPLSWGFGAPSALWDVSQTPPERPSSVCRSKPRMLRTGLRQLFDTIFIGLGQSGRGPSRATHREMRQHQTRRNTMKKTSTGTKLVPLGKEGWPSDVDVDRRKCGYDRSIVVWLVKIGESALSSGFGSTRAYMYKPLSRFWSPHVCQWPNSRKPSYKP